MKKKQSFNSVADAKSGLEWMIEFLEEELNKASKHKDPLEISEEIIETIHELEILSNTLGEKIEQDFEQSASRIWEQIIDINDESYSYKKNAEPMVWGLWRLAARQEFNFGYTDYSLDKDYVPKNSEEKIHDYKKLPPPIRWKLNKVVQKDVVFYTTCVNVAQIEQISSVPALPHEMSSEEAGLRVLDGNRAPHEWQRRPSNKRIQSIMEFVKSENNIVANAPLLFIKDPTSVKIIDNELIVDFKDFIIKKPNLEIESKANEMELYTDHVIIENPESDLFSENFDYKDLRPIWIIDGQHRIRGLSRDKEGAKLDIPVIIFPNEFSLPKAAKIFAEINTLQESLKPLHQLYMQHRFKISSPNSKRNFEEWKDKRDPDKDSMANHLSYELIAKLASRKDSALFNKVRILDENDSIDFYVKADQWVNYARTWFLHSGPYAQSYPWTAEKEENLYNEVNNYFLALKKTINHDGWDGPRWTDTKVYKSLLQSSTHFKVLIDLYPDVHMEVKSKKEVFTVEDFMKVLVPFKWVDWLDSKLKSHFGGGGERGRSSLYIWMSDALACRESHKYKSVMSSSIKSIPGKGIMAGPLKSEINVIGKWPSPGKPIKFSSKRPINARRKPEWIIEDENGQVKSNKVLTIKSNNECLIYYDTWLDKINSFKLSVVWSNASSDQGTSSVKITN